MPLIPEVPYAPAARDTPVLVDTQQQKNQQKKDEYHFAIPFSLTATALAGNAALIDPYLGIGLRGGLWQEKYGYLQIHEAEIGFENNVSGTSDVKANINRYLLSYRFIVGNPLLDAYTQSISPNIQVGWTWYGGAALTAGLRTLEIDVGNPQTPNTTRYALAYTGNLVGGALLQWGWLQARNEITVGWREDGAALGWQLVFGW